MYPIFNPHQTQNNSLAQAGIDPCHLNLKHLDLTATPPGLFLKTVSFLSYLILVFHIVANFQPSSSSKQLAGTSGNRSVLLRLETLWFDPTTSRLLLKEVTFLLTLILVFHIVNNFIPGSTSKQLDATGRNRYQLQRFETVWLDLYTNRVIAEGGCFFFIIFNPRLLHCK